MSASILTNMSAMSAVQNLAATQSALATTENQISTGLKVSSAKDNAAYWSIATSMKTTTGELSSVNDSLNLGSSILSTASSAMTNVVSIMQKMASELVTAQGSGADLGKIGNDISQLVNQLKSTTNAASFNGVNLLSSTQSSIQIVTSVTGSGSSFSVGALSIALSGTNLVQASGGSAGMLDTVLSSLSSITSTTSLSSLQNMSVSLDTALASVQTAASTIGSYQNDITLQQTFVSSLSDSITQGIGSLEDADMNQASTRLNALQTQQQLGIQALSVANQNSQMILKLFG